MRCFAVRPSPVTLPSPRLSNSPVLPRPRSSTRFSPFRAPYAIWRSRRAASCGSDGSLQLREQFRSRNPRARNLSRSTKQGVQHELQSSNRPLDLPQARRTGLPQRSSRYYHAIVRPHPHLCGNSHPCHRRGLGNMVVALAWTDVFTVHR